MDKFPEAFRRFEEVVDARRIRGFRQLELSFRFWQGYELTPRQKVALSIEGLRAGILPRPRIYYRYVFHRRGRMLYRWTFQRRGKTVYVWRDARGRFARL